MSSKSTLLTKRVLGVIAIVVIVLGGVSGYYYWYVPAEQRRLAEEAKRTAEEAYTKKLALIPRPDTIVHDVIMDPQFLDPATCGDSASLYVLDHVLEPLVRFDWPNLDSFVPVLAEDLPTISQDGLSYTFKLRKGIKFQDGTPFNASCVKYNFDRVILISELSISTAKEWGQYLRGALKYQKSKMNQTDVKEYLAARGVEVLDDYTVRVNIVRPYAYWIITMASSGGYIISPTACEKHGGVRPGEHNEWMDRNPVGTGPYRFVEWLPKQRVVLEAWENYRGASPKIKKVILRNVPELGSRRLAFFTGEADIIDIKATDVFDFIERDPWLKDRKMVVKRDLDLLPRGTSLNMVTYPKVGYNFIALNKRFPPLDNRDFRYGLAFAFDYNTFINDIYNGFAKRQYGAISAIFEEYAAKPGGEVFTFDYDPAKAKEYFLKAKTAGAYKEGVTVWYGYNEGDEVRRRGGLLLKDAVEKLGVGVTIDVRPLAYPEHLRYIRDGKYPMFMGLFTGTAAGGPHGLLENWAHSEFGVLSWRTQIYRDDPKWKEDVDAKVDRAVVTTDAAERRKLYNYVMNRVNEEACGIWAANPSYIKLMRDWVQLETDPKTGVPRVAAMEDYNFYYMWKGY